MALDSGSINLWDSLQQSSYHNFTDIHKAPAMALAFSPFNDLISASVGLDKYLIVYDVTRHKYVCLQFVPLNKIYWKALTWGGLYVFINSNSIKTYIFII